MQLWQVLKKYHELPDQLEDLHIHFKDFKYSIQTDFGHLKQASSQNIQNIQSTLSIQQTYTSTLSSHITNIYSKLTELQQQIQQHCMYPHYTEVHQTDTVQIEAPDYNPDIDGDQEFYTDNKWATVSVQDILYNSHDLP